MIEVKNVTKCYGKTVALNDVTLTFGENSIYGLLGRNGAGKSTLLSLITNRNFPTSGEVLIDGRPVIENDAVLGRVYCMSENSLYPESMTVKDALKWTGEFYPKTDAEYAQKLADQFQLNTKKKIKALSTGYSSIFKIIVALSCNASILLLDEPVLGLDANFREVFYRELLEHFAAHPKTIVISTHLIEEAANVIDKVAIIKKGRLVLNDTAENVLSAGYTVTGPAAAVDAYAQGLNVLGSDSLGGMKSAYVLGEPDKSKLSGDLEVSRLRLQSLFIHLTNS